MAPAAAAQVERLAPASDDPARNAPATPIVSAMDADNGRAAEHMALGPAAPAADSVAPAGEVAAAPQASQSQAHSSPPQTEPAPPQTKVAIPTDEEDVALADKPPEIPAPGETEYGSASSLSGMSFLDADAADRSSAIYFGGDAMGSPNKLQSWAPGAEPILVSPSAELAAQSADSNIKLSALEGTDNDTGSGESVAGKDDVSRLQTPAQRLGLEGKARAKAEKCLADAVYFEARGEVRKGQEAVAQVVMNRVFSGYYPHDVCGVVYQNAHRHLACQFTFACEGKDLSRIDEPDMWEQAKSIAKDTLDGKIWLAEVGHATHYHAYWVHPSWVHEMTRLFKLGVHTFYRPRNWGDGEDEPVWGKTAPTAPSASNNETPSSKSEGAKTDVKTPQAAAPVAGART
jgi:spore germination cell wall hydrolase CwlJ-like protein